MTLPVSMISFATAWARSTGMANPRPTLPALDWPFGLGTVAPAEGTPMSCPAQLVIAPPLLPGLMAASVWTAETSSALWPLSPGTSMVRSRALTMPAVTVLDRPNGAPEHHDRLAHVHTARTCPNGMTGRVRLTWTLITARSAWGSRPVMVAGRSCRR